MYCRRLCRWDICEGGVWLLNKLFAPLGFGLGLLRQFEVINISFELGQASLKLDIFSLAKPDIFL